MTTQEVLNKLKSDYDLREKLMKRNWNVPDQLEDEIEELEQAYIDCDIIPRLELYAYNLLSDLKCALTLKIRKTHNLDVFVSDEDDYRLDTSLIHFIERPTFDGYNDTIASNNQPIELNATNRYESEGRDLRVTFPDGEVFEGGNCKDTFINALKKIGLSRIPDVGLTFAGYNLVDTIQRTDGGIVWQQKVDDYWVYINSGNARKVNCLLKIARYYNIPLKIEAI